MIKTRNQLEAVQNILLDYAGRDHLPVTIERIAFALNGQEVVAIPTSGSTLVATFTLKAIKRIMHNQRECSCYLVAITGDDTYDEAAGLIVQINAPEEADGTGRNVYYAATIEHEHSGIVQLYQTIKNPKRKAKKVPALGFAGGSVKVKHKAPKKAKRERGYHYAGIAGA
jgi:hypothetical protein